MSDGVGLEVWRGGVNPWECDEMGHMNVRFYVSRAMEGLTAFAGALGLHGAFRASAEATLIVKGHHIRFLREARPGAPLVMTAGLLDVGDTDVRILQLLLHADSGDIAASFQTLAAHATAREGRAFPWSRTTHDRARRLSVAVPDPAAPRSLDPAPSAATASVAEADRLGLVALSAGAFGAQDCDVFGRVRPELFIGRVSDGVPALAAAFGLGGQRAPGEGRAVVEYRLAYLAWPRAGDLFEIRAGLAGVEARTQRTVHWILDPATGAPWASAEAVAVAFDLETRKLAPISPQRRAHLAARVTPGLAF